MPVASPALWTWSIRCWHPGDTAHRWESRCRPSYCPSQSVSQHRWQTPANASSHSSSLSCPIRRHIMLLIEVDRTESQTNIWVAIFRKSLATKSYPANSRLHDGVKATLWHIDICRYTLPCNYLIEPISAARQRQEVFVSKSWQARWAYTAATQQKSKTILRMRWWNFQPQTYSRKRGRCWSVWSCFSIYFIPAGVGQLFFCDFDEGQDGFLHKRAKAHSKFTGEVGHLFRQRGAQAFDHLQVIDHGCWQVHQVVDVHRIVLCVLNLDLESHLTACAKTKSTPYFCLKMKKTLLEANHQIKMCTRSQLESHFLRGDLSAVIVACLLPEWAILQDLTIGNRELQLAPGTSLF